MLHLQKVDVQNAEKIQTENNDQHAANTPDVILIGNQDLPNEAGGGAEGDEDNGEAGDKEERIGHDDRFEAGPRVCIGELFDRQAGDIGNIGGSN